MRGNLSINDYDEPRMICLESLVLASEWILTKHASGLTVRGSPVCRSLGSPLAVILETPASTVFVSGAAMEAELVNPERYKRGKERVSVLIVGFYCTKKYFASEGACFHVSFAS